MRISRIIVISLFPVLAWSQNLKDIPSTYLNFITDKVGIWTTDSLANTSADQPFERFEIEWKWGIGKKNISGEFYGIKGGKRAVLLVELKQFWDLELKKSVILQFQPNGSLGKSIFDINNDSNIDETITVSYSPDGTISKSGLRIESKEGKKIFHFYSINENGEWEKIGEQVWFKK